MKENIVGYVFHESVMTEADVRSVKEQKNGTVLIEAVLQEANLPNRNKRIYPKNVIQEALETPYVREKLNTKSWSGEANHPAGNDVNRQMSIDMNNVSHIVKKTYWDPQDSNLLVGLVETAGTITGQNMAGLILKNGMECSFSMRGLGDVIKENNGCVRVKNPLKLICYDLVSFPSHTKAYQRKILMNEATAITVRNLAEYAAKDSNAFQQLNEEVFQFSNDDISFSLNEKQQLVITDKHTMKPQGIVILETKIRNEIDDFFKNFKM